MRNMTLDELKVVCYETLGFFADFCEKNNLRYCLYAGTLLGAIRHEGFIPWDDDIDVAMPREDYNKFIELYNNSSVYKLACHEKCDNYYYPFAKLYDSRTRIIEEHFYCGIDLGVYIDIFPIDGNGSDFELAKKHFLKCVHTQHMLNNAFSTHFFKSNSNKIKETMRYIRYKGIRIVGKDYYLKKLVTMTQEYGFESSQYVANNVWSGYGVRELLPREWFEEYDIGRFEGGEFRIPREYDKMLSAIYGEYMILPPEEKRISHHDMEVYWL